MTFSFERFSKAIEECKKDKVADLTGENYILLTTMSGFTTDMIDFDAFTAEDCENVLDDLDNLVLYEIDYDGEIAIDPGHPFSLINGLVDTIATLETVNKVIPKSPHLFL